MPRTETLVFYTEIHKDIYDDGTVRTRLGRSWQSLSGSTKKKPAKALPQRIEVDQDEDLVL